MNMFNMEKNKLSQSHVQVVFVVIVTHFPCLDLLNPLKTEICFF